MINNDYQNCDFYQNQAKNVNKEGFVTFFDEATAKYYFAFVNVKTKKVIFRSEGYPTAKAQTTGLNSFLKNRVEEKQFSIVNENGEFFVILKAKNKVEIGRSCPFATENEALNVINYCVGKEEVKVAVAGKTKKETISTKEEVVATAVKVAAKAPKATATKTTKITFAPNEAYIGHERLTDEFGTTGFALFQGSDAKYYFAVYNDDNSLFQRSMGFDSAEQRDATFTTIKSALLNDEAYKVVQENENFVVEIVSDNGTTLAKSLAYPTFAQAFLNTPRGWTQPTETISTLY
jgi:uncharacterized protein YegP (UPF0339 family)